MTTCPGAQIAVVAVGTRGDVEPLLHLAAALQRGESGARVTLITHSAHAFVQGPAQEACLCLRLLSGSPARHWDAGVQHGEAAGAPASSSSAEESHREEVLSACQAALGCRLMGGGAVAATSAGPRLLIFNLFALECFSVAEALRVPCAAASPCLVPNAPPAGFQRRFQAAHPQLYRRLREAGDGQGARVAGWGRAYVSACCRFLSCHLSPPHIPAVLASPASFVPASAVGWAEVAHWMWPLLNSERWGAWRHHRLSLPSMPFSAVPPEQPLPPPPPLLYGASCLDCCAFRAVHYVMLGVQPAGQHQADIMPPLLLAQA